MQNDSPVHADAWTVSIPVLKPKAELGMIFYGKAQNINRNAFNGQNPWLQKSELNIKG